MKSQTVSSTHLPTQFVDQFCSYDADAGKIGKGASGETFSLEQVYKLSYC